MARLRALQGRRTGLRGLGVIAKSACRRDIVPDQRARRFHGLKAGLGEVLRRQSTGAHHHRGERTANTRPASPVHPITDASNRQAHRTLLCVSIPLPHGYTSVACGRQGALARSDAMKKHEMDSGPLVNLFHHFFEKRISNTAILTQYWGSCGLSGFTMDTHVVCTQPVFSVGS